jgi:CHAD domain-containing protein
MRVALRRMRTAFALLRRELGLPALQAFNDDARWLTKLLGAARDWDVFTCETLSEIAQYLPPDIANFEALREAAVPPSGYCLYGVAGIARR